MRAAIRTQWKELLLLALGYGSALCLLARAPAALPAGHPWCSATICATGADTATDPAHPVMGTGAAASVRTLWVTRQGEQELTVRTNP